MTEEEAKKKICPVGAMRGSYDGNWDKGPCIGNRCMAWRWDSIPNPNYTPFMAQFPPQAEPAYIKSETDGHCGLAHG